MSMPKKLGAEFIGTFALVSAVCGSALFSATFSNDIRRLADGLLQAPDKIDVAPRNTTVERINQLVHPVARENKRALLSWLIDTNSWHQVLVFTRTKHGANRLADQLNRAGIEAAAIHGNKSQNARTAALARFKNRRIRVLVATDIAARGLDINLLPHVVNYELPNVPEDYVHRIGRTGRAGEEGVAISLVDQEEVALLADIERLLKGRIENLPVPAFEPKALTSKPAPQRAEPSKTGGQRARSERPGKKTPASENHQARRRRPRRNKAR